MNSDHQLSPKKRLFRRAALTLSIFFVCFLAVALTVSRIDFGRYKDRLALLVSNKIEREFRIDGELKLRLGPTVKIQARDIKILNESWARDRALLSINSLDTVIDLWSIISGPIRVRRLNLQGAAIHLEKKVDGIYNWSVGKHQHSEHKKQTSALNLPVVIEALNGRDISIVISHPQLQQDTRINIESIKQRLLSDGLQTYLNASVNKIPFNLESHIGPLNSILENRNIDFNFSSNIGETKFDAAGNIDKLFPTHLSYLDAELIGPDIDHLFRTLHLPKITSGPLALKARVETTQGKSDISLSGQAGELSVSLNGWLSRTSKNNIFDLAFKSTGPEFDSLKHLIPAATLPPGPFSFHGRVSQNRSLGRKFTVNLEVAGTQLAAYGRVDRFLSPQNLDGTVRILSNDVSPFRQMLGLPLLPAVEFEMDSRVSMISDGAVKISAKTRLGTIQSSVQVQLDDLNLNNANVKFNSSGPKADVLARVFDIKGIPSVPFQMDADLWVRENLLEIVAFNSRLAESHVDLKGKLGLTNRFDKTELRFETTNINLETWLGKHGLNERLANPLNASGKIRIKNAKLNLEDLSIQLAKNRMHGQLNGSIVPFLGDGQFDLHFLAPHPSAMFPEAALYQLELDSLEAEASGRWTGNQLEISHGTLQSSGTKLEISGTANWPLTFENIDMKIHASGQNLAMIWKSPHLKVPDLPFNIGGHIGKSAGFFDVALSDVTSTVSFKLTDANINDVRLKFKTTAPNADVFEQIFGFVGIPPLSFNADGEIQIQGTRLDLASCNLQLGRTHLTTEGRIFLTNGLQDSDVRLVMTDFDLAPWLGEIPLRKALTGTIDASARVRVKDGECIVDALSARMERNHLKANVTVNLRPFFSTGHFDLKLSAINPATFFPQNEWFKPSSEAVEATAVGNWAGKRWEFTQATIDSTALDLEIHGSVAGTSKINTINLALDAYGSNLALVGQSSHFNLPALPFSITGKITGEDKFIKLHNLSASIGDSDIFLSANVGLENANHPELALVIQSRKLDLQPFQHAFKSRPADITSDSSKKTGDSRVIQPIPIPFDLLDGINMQADILVEDLNTSCSDSSYLKLKAMVKDGSLHIDELTSDGKSGRITAVIDAMPNGGTYEMEVKMIGKALCLSPPGETEQLRDLRPRYELSAKLDGYGNNLQALAASLNGTVEVTGGKGTVPRLHKSLTGFFFNDFVTTVFDTINPLNKQKDKLQINCIVLLLDVNDGIISGDPALVVQTGDINFYTAGTLNLTTEKLDLDIISNSRRGIGISIGDFVNPFIKIGGTLAAPRVISDPKSTVTETSAGILTGGLWPLAKKIRDRFLTGDPCRKALENRSGESR